jgi:hypothetical protein
MAVLHGKQNVCKAGKLPQAFLRRCSILFP